MRAWTCGVVGMATVFGSALVVRGEDGSAALAGVESLIDRAEAANGRPFDPGFRDFASRELRLLEANELAGRQERVGTAGLGGLAAPGDPRRDLVFTPLPPCRIADTRTAGGSLAVGVPRSFRVTGIALDEQGGNAAGCDVPVGGAVSALLNFVAVNPVGPGNLRAWAYSTPPAAPPNASILNYAFIAGAGLNIANGIAVPLCDVTTTSCPFDLRVQADGSGTQLVMDVVGYFHRFEREAVRSFTVTARNNAATPILSPPECTSHGQVTIDAPVAGRVVVQVAAGFRFQHQAGVRDYLTAQIRTNPDDCASSPLGDDFRWLIVSQTPGGESQNTASMLREFSVTAGEHTFYLNSAKAGSPAIDDAFLEKLLVATFYPN